MSRATMRSLARDLGVSPTTVSLALRNHPSIPEATRLKIETAAHEAGYRQNALLGAFMSDLRVSRRKTTMVYLGVLTDLDQPLAKTGYRWVCKGMNRRADEMGCELTEFSGVGKTISHARILEVLKARGIKGVIVATELDLSLFPRQALQGFSIAGCGYSDPEYPIHRSVMHHAADMENLFTQMWGKGFRRIGFAVDAGTDEANHQQWSGRFLARTWSLSVPSVSATFRAPDFAPSTRASFARWLQSFRPDSLIVGSSNFFPWIDSHVASGGPWIPTACMNLWWKGDFHSGIRQDLDSVASTMVDLVLEQMSLNQTGFPLHPRGVLIQGSLIEGKTLGAVPVRLAL